jgi:DNA helicase-2/ATP-dependent DNA helicase PcrA
MTASTEILSQNEILQQWRHNLRPGQQSLADWQGGRMAISAVPGSGKSHSLAVAAAMTITRHQLHGKKQLLIVTYTRSAASSIKEKIKKRLKELQLPQSGFMVQTLHGLALQIASRHPDLSQLNLETASIVIPTPSHRIIRAAVEQWMLQFPYNYQTLLEGLQFDGEEAEKLRRQSVLRTEVLPNIAHTVVREAKSSGLTLQQVWDLSEYATDSYKILTIAAGLYEQYERLMRSRDFIDYDDMILAALRVLENDAIRKRWQNSIFAVFEDEAQDSSPLQEKLISILANDPHDPNLPPNLIRVGDPNQAINSTFTPADPVYFNWFCDRCKEQNKLATMDQAGRSSKMIIESANFVLSWVNQTWNTKNNQTEKPFRLQSIQTVNSNDPQADANPESVGQGLEIYTPEDIYETVNLIEKRVMELLTNNPEHNAAILVRENRQGRFLAEKFAHFLKQYGIRVYEVSESDRFSKMPEEICKLLQFLDRPHSPDYLKATLEILEKRGLISAQDLNALATYPEQFLYPTPLENPQKKEVEIARTLCCELLKARLELPHYQLIPFLGMKLKYSGSELATAQKLASRIYQQTLGNSSLKSTITALNEIITSERFEAVEDDNDELYTRKKQLTIITMHKAKGLDWDYVFLPFLHEDILPGNLRVPVAAKFLGDFGIAEVARAQLRSAVHTQYQNLSPRIPQPLQAWTEAGQLKKAEEFRLLYVAMTRAKRLLWMSSAKMGPFRWNTFRSDQSTQLQTKKPCPVIPVLLNHFPESMMTF